MSAIRLKLKYYPLMKNISLSQSNYYSVKLVFFNCVTQFDFSPIISSVIIDQIRLRFKSEFKEISNSTN